MAAKAGKVAVTDTERPPHHGPERNHSFISTGSLPEKSRVQALVDQAHDRFRSVDTGSCSDVYPALAVAEREHFGICLVDTSGQVYSAGDAGVAFTMMSVAKPFVFALACDAVGTQEALAAVGANATGRAFNSFAAVEDSADGRTNPMVNSGAIAATGLLAAGGSLEQHWAIVSQGISRFAGRDLAVDEAVLHSARQTNHHNQGLARLLTARGRLTISAEDAVEVYTRQSCLSVSAHDLAVMGATLADGGVNPVTGEQVVSRSAAACALAVMATAGLYETSGEWLATVGLPGKSGIAGGIVTSAPGKGGLGTFAPPLDAAGNSVRGQLVARFLADRLGLDLFASEPAART